MSDTTLILVRTPHGHPLPWLFDSESQAARALELFRKAGIHPTVFTEGLWNDADEVQHAIANWRERGELAQYKHMNRKGQEWPV